MPKYNWPRRGLLLKNLMTDPDAALNWLATYLPAAQCDAFAAIVAPVDDALTAAQLTRAKELIENYAPAEMVADVSTKLTAEIERLKPVEDEPAPVVKK